MRGLRVLNSRCKGPTPSFLSARVGASDKNKDFLKMQIEREGLDHGPNNCKDTKP
jgi:hypothetical protein